ncbi:MAG: VWA domain-containing protein [bacterium]
MSFAYPWVLALLALVPLYLAWEVLRRRAALRYSDIAFTRRARGSGAWLRMVPPAFFALALAAMVVALARPRQGRQFEEIETRGIDIMLCLDLSGSMQAEDFSPRNRLEVAKTRAREFVERRVGDRVGLVAFAATALTQCPLTHDKNIVSELIGRLNFDLLEILEDGTAIGVGLGTAVARLRESEAKEKVIILLTDGVNNTGDIDPLTAARTAASFGIKVYAIGIGTSGPVPFPVQDPVFGRRRVRIEIEFDMPTLHEIAGITGGQAFLASDDAALARVYEEIDRLQPTEFKARRHTVYYERAGLPILLALVFATAGVLLSATAFRRLP